MSAPDSVLSWFDRLKPLWDFLTAVGTLSLAAATYYLARLARPKVHLSVSLNLINENKALLIRITNGGDVAPVLHKCLWLSASFSSGRIEFPLFPLSINGVSGAYGTPRLAKGDIAETWRAIDECAEWAEKLLPNNLSQAQIERALWESSVTCATTTGESFGSALPPDVHRALVKRVVLIRTPI